MGEIRDCEISIGDYIHADQGVSVRESAQCDSNGWKHSFIGQTDIYQKLLDNLVAAICVVGYSATCGLQITGFNNFR